jgi:collagen triple helix repeat protein
MNALRGWPTAVLLVVALTAGAAGATALGGGSDSTVRLCVAKDGSVRVVKKGCRSGEKLVVVNQQGVPGAAGPAGSTGAPGAPGPSGAPGSTGPTGAAGPSGAPGSTGPSGPTGAPGSTGPSGPTGPTGPPGADAPTPVVLPQSTGSFVLSLGEGLVQRVRSVAGCSQPDFDLPAQPCRLELVGLPRPETLAWIAAASGPSPTHPDVTLTELSATSQSFSVLDIKSASITRIGLTDLDAASAQQASIVIDVTGGLNRKDGDGSTVSLGPTPTALRDANFRVAVDGTPFDRITRVEDLAVDLTAPAPTLQAHLVSSVTGNGGQRLRGWAEDARGGQLSAVTIELLNANLTATLLTINGHATGPVGSPEPFGFGPADASKRISVDMAGDYAGLS